MVEVCVFIFIFTFDFFDLSACLKILKVSSMCCCFCEFSKPNW